MAYGAPSEVTPAHELTGNFPSHNGAAVAAGIETKNNENSIEIAPKILVRIYLPLRRCKDWRLTLQVTARYSAT